MTKKKIKAALVYDFDGTLAEGNCAEHGLMPALGIEDIDGFWSKVSKETKHRDADEILTYLGALALQAKAIDKKEQLTPKKLQQHGKEIPLFPGVLKWFDRINKYAEAKDVELEHYIVSSGIEEMIQGTEIAKHFSKIFACRYHYDDESGHVKWPAVAINYTGKTQYIFRINKGVLNCYDSARVNAYIERDKRPVPFENMIFLGDGDTDIPCMRLVKDQGGCSVAVFDQKKWPEKRNQEKIQKLISENRVNFVVPGNYTEGSQLDVTVKGILGKIYRKSNNQKAE